MEAEEILAELMADPDSAERIRSYVAAHRGPVTPPSDEEITAYVRDFDLDQMDSYAARCTGRAGVGGSEAALAEWVLRMTAELRRRRDDATPEREMLEASSECLRKALEEIAAAAGIERTDEGGPKRNGPLLEDIIAEVRRLRPAR